VDMPNLDFERDDCARDVRIGTVGFGHAVHCGSRRSGSPLHHTCTPKGAPHSIFIELYRY
jgi:hypothetical protein